MSKKKKDEIAKLITNNLLAVSILVSTLIISITLVFVFGGSSSPSGSPSVGGGTPIPQVPSVGGDPLSVDNLKLMARSVGVDEGNFDSCLDSGVHTDAVSAETRYGETLGVNGTPSFFVNGVLVVGALPFDQFATTIDSALAGNVSEDVINVDIGNSPILGDPNAPVTIVEFSDYECPFCAKFYSDTLPLIKSNYIDTGKVKLVYKDFPLSFHPNAVNAAEAARCVRDQFGDDGYWQMHDRIFDAISG